MSHVGDGDGEFLFFPLTVTPAEVQAVRAQVDAITADNERQTQNSDRVDVTLSQLVATTIAPEYWYGDSAVEETQRWQDLRARFHENAAWGDALAMAALHVCSARGLGEAQPRPDPAAAYRWAQAAMNVAQPPGLGEWVMARCYSRGLGVSINKQTAVQLFRLSHDKGFALGTHAAAYQLMVHGLTREDILEARTMLQPLADEVPQAAILLAQHFSGAYGQGLGFPTDFASAAHYYQKAYDAGDAFSGFTLYVAYATGEPGLPPRDLTKAEAFLREAASRGHNRAQAALASELGHLPYYQTNFLNLSKNPRPARRWLELSTNQGYPDACFALGRLLVQDEHGLGYQPDPSRARTFVDRAADRRHSQATVYKALWQLDGSGPYEQDEQQAFRTAKRAADRNDPHGCALLGMLFEYGVTLDLPADERQLNAYHRYSHHALHWSMRAILLGGNDEADRRLKKFRGHLNLERKGVPFAGLTDVWPSAVMADWKQQFPKTAREFDQRY